VDQHTVSKADKAKRRKTRELIEQELYTYEQSRREIERRIAEIDDIASPRSNWPPIGHASTTGESKGARRKGDVVAFIEGRNGRGRGQTSDPTAARAQKVWDYRNSKLSSKAFLVMCERVEAVSDVLDRLGEAAVGGDRAARIELAILRRKYFRRASDETIWNELGISKTTFYRHRRAIIEAIAQELGWVV